MACTSNSLAGFNKSDPGPRGYNPGLGARGHRLDRARGYRRTMTPIEIFFAVVLVAILGWLTFDQLRISRQERDRD